MNNQSKNIINDLHVFELLCDFCGCCVAVCPVDCIELEENCLAIDRSVCTLCGNCPKACPVGAIRGENS